MLKTITFAVMHFSIAFVVTYLITGSFMLGGLVAVIEPAVNSVAYFFHEKIWQKFSAAQPQSAVAAQVNYSSNHS